MPKFSETTLTGWTKPPSNTEEAKLSNSEKMVKDTVANDATLSPMGIEVFGQGSYANNTNVRLDSDIDINVRYTDAFYYGLPDYAVAAHYGIAGNVAYSYSRFKNDVYSAMIRKFGTASVVRKNKCITILANTNRVETDVVPTWNYRRYSSVGNYVLGAKLWSDSGTGVVNFPKQHIQNGIQKNARTSRRFKGLTRLHRKIRYRMIDDGLVVSDAISSFLLECLVWNVPENVFLDYDTWNERLKQSIIFIYDQTNNEAKSKTWGEVSELLYLFDSSRKWSRADVAQYMTKLWNYLEY